MVARTDVRTGDPRRDTILKLMRPITVDFQEKRAEDRIADLVKKAMQTK